jgi:hypothetical protein
VIRLDNIRAIVQERDRFLAMGSLPGGISAVTIAAQGGLSGSASDYMRLAMPVRDPDNGDPISGPGKKILRVSYPACEGSKH